MAPDLPFAVLGRLDPDQIHFSAVGSGVVIDPRGLVVTAAHVIQAFQQTFTPYELTRNPDNLFVPQEPFPDLEQHEHLRVVPYPKEPPAADGTVGIRMYPALSTTGFGSHDVAVIELGGKGDGRPLPSLGLSTTGPIAGDAVTAKGAASPPGLPLGVPSFPSLLTQDTEVVVVGKDHFFIDGETPKGISGGPVLDPKSGRVLGVIVESWPPELAMQELNLKRSVTKVTNFRAIAATAAAQYLKARNRVELGGVSYIV